MSDFYDAHSIDEITREVQCDSCQTEFVADFGLVFDNTYEHECPNCHDVVSFEFCHDEDYDSFDSYYDR